MIKILFFASAAADWNRIRSPVADISKEHVKEALAVTLTHVSNGECERLKLHVSPKLKETLKRLGDVVDDVGNLFAQENPMVSPIVMMAKSYILSSGNTLIDSIVNNYVCHVIHAVPDAVKQEVIPHVKELVKHLGNRENCDDLIKTLKNVFRKVRNFISETLDFWSAQLLKQFDQESMAPWVGMGKEYVLGMLDEWIHEFIEQNSCAFVYAYESDEL